MKFHQNLYKIQSTSFNKDSSKDSVKQPIDKTAELESQLKLQKDKYELEIAHLKNEYETTIVKKEREIQELKSKNIELQTKCSDLEKRIPNENTKTDDVKLLDEA